MSGYVSRIVLVETSDEDEGSWWLMAAEVPRKVGTSDEGMERRKDSGLW